MYPVHLLSRYGGFGAYLESTGFSAQQQARLRELLANEQEWRDTAAVAKQ